MIDLTVLTTQNFDLLLCDCLTVSDKTFPFWQLYNKRRSIFLTKFSTKACDTKIQIYKFIDGEQIKIFLKLKYSQERKIMKTNLFELKFKK